MANEGAREELGELRARIERLEQLAGVAGGQPTPGFNPAMFQRILLGYMMRFFVLFFVPLFVALQLITIFQGQVAKDTLFGLPLWNVGGEPSLLGLPVGVLSLGGGAIGIVSLGGLAIGVLAIGGGALGIVAIGGGAVGL